MRAARYVQAKIASAGPAWRSTRQDLTAGLISGALRVAPGVAAAVQRRAIASFLVIQRKTALTFNPAHDKAGSVKIASVAHQRELHNSTQRTLAAYLSGYGTPPGGTCNHHVPYTLIRSEIERKLTSAADLEAAVLWMHALNLPGAENYDWNQWGWQLAANSQFSVGAMPSPHITPTKTVLGTAYYAEAALNETVNDLIWNLANDPRNLFYWPNSTGDGGGTTVDNPTGAGSMPIKHITGRLQSYRTKLQNLGLNV
jgi:hypothetical protein